MDANLRPDLTRILPRPVTRPRGGMRFDGAISIPDSVTRTDYLVAIERKFEPDPDEAGFELHQAQAAAERVARGLGTRALRPGLFALDPGRVQRLLS